jgi:anthranilate phosphoribosyltransferase
MSDAFRELLRKIGSGPHTGKDLSRQEAAAATRMMLLQEATPAQMGAFMIAQRMKRPTGEELAGMLDAYDELGPKLQSITSPRPVTVLGSPYDGRDRTAPLSPLTALILAAADCPTILHGGERMPTKEGVPLVDFWQGLGVNWRSLSLDAAQQVLARTGIGFVYLPMHFPLACGLIPYREQIGKRPPFATLELMWCPYAGDAHVVTGFVHPPTEEFVKAAFALRGTTYFTTVKGLEGSCDLPRERTVIIGLNGPSGGIEEFERLHLSPRDYSFAGRNVPLESVSQVVADMQAVLAGKPGELMQSALWNGGFYLWRCGVCKDMNSAIATAEEILIKGQAAQKLKQVQAAVASLPLAHQA